MTVKPPRVLPYGDAALLIQYETGIGFSRAISEAVHSLAARLRANGYWQDVVPAYNSILVSFNPAVLSLEGAKRRLEDKIANQKPLKKIAGRHVEIPVCYTAKYGPDMKNIMAVSGLSRQEIINLHSDDDYLVCMMGFVPGFAFLSDVPAIIHHPRHTTPRLKVPAGAVGIAGWQTGIYGMESPGGWQIIGRTPLKIFDKTRAEPFLIEAGDTIKFNPITAPEFESLSHETLS